MEKLLQLSWQVPFGKFSLQFDSLNIIFLIAIAILFLCSALYGVGYMRPYLGKKSLSLHSFFYVLLGLVLFFIVTASNVILFLGAWELLTISTFFLIMFNDEKPAVRKASFIYLIASHYATFFLFVMFFLMAHIAGSMDFKVMAQTNFPVVFSGVIFILALIGFGVKAGFLPLHIWLPYAHPAAPSHISALLSGVTIKMGIYGICRIIWIMKILPDWCGYLLLVIGVISGVMGVLYALGQHELKRLLAYHSVENIGIIALGLGVGLIGRNHNMPFLAVLGFSGGLLHVLNHSLFKGLLFLGAGAVIQKTHTGDMDQLGGLAKSMPITSVLFLIGALSICGLPLFNGFISEFIIYFGLFKGLLSLPLQGIIFCSVGILSLALMGALALACFSKVYGTVFSGNARTAFKETTNHENIVRQEASKWMIFPMVILAGICIWIGVAPKTMVGLTFLSGAYLAQVDIATIPLEQVLMPLTMVIGILFLFLALSGGLIIIRKLLQGFSPMPIREIWGCGFTKISARFQYTSSSFARSIVDFAKNILRVHHRGGHIFKIFPGETHMASSVHDVSEEMLFRPLLSNLTNFSKKMDNSRIRHTQMYLMYIFLFLIFLLVWKLK